MFGKHNYNYSEQDATSSSDRSFWLPATTNTYWYLLSQCLLPRHASECLIKTATSPQKSRLLFAGTVQRTTNERPGVTRRVMLEPMTGGESPGPGRRKHTQAQCLAQTISRCFGPPGDPRTALLWRSEYRRTVSWPTAGKKGGKWYRRGRRSGGLFYGEVTQGRGGEERAGYATRHRAQRVGA